MVVNNSRTKFFVINSEDGEAELIRLEGLVMEHCDSYVYLGRPSLFTWGGPSIVTARCSRLLVSMLRISYVIF